VKTVAICDKEPVAIEGLRTLLHTTGEWRVVASERRPADLLDSVRAWSPDVAVFDRAFGLEPVLNAIQTMRGSGLATAPVVWGVSISEADAVRLLRAGALGVVRKTCTLSALVECMASAAGGGTWVDEGLAPAAEAAPRVAPPSLTRRELQIMELVERSLRNREIAAALGIRVGTVKIHLRHIFEKTGIRGRYGLALLGLRAKRTAIQVM
jgi:two-component system, NarL family, nitrate/nitrite response regulator NarL